MGGGYSEELSRYICRQYKFVTIVVMSVAILQCMKFNGGNGGEKQSVIGKLKVFMRGEIKIG